jgi:very-short-patch-repair endonuclease
MGRRKRTGNSVHAIAREAHRQHGIVTRGQLRELGLGDWAISDRIASGYLLPVFPGTFAVGHRAISREGWLHAGVLACNEGTVLSHGSAAELLGLWDKALPVVHVIPPDWSGRKIDRIRWHRVRLPLPDEIEVRDGIRCTSISRTIVDMAGESGWTRLRGLVEQAAILRKLEVDEIDLVLSRGRRRGAPRLRSILSDWRTTSEPQPRLRSRLEARLFPLLVKEGLPVPRSNAKLKLDGQTFEIDLFWQQERLAIETDGEQTHGTAAAFERDRRRDQILVAAGYRTARVTWMQVRDEPNAVLQRITRMLKHSGAPIAVWDHQRRTGTE